MNKRQRKKAKKKDQAKGGVTLKGVVEYGKLGHKVFIFPK